MRKELRETLRDRRTVITLVLMPLLVYPLLSISFNKSMLLTAEQAEQPSLTIGLESRQDLELLEKLLLEGERLVQAKKQARNQRTKGSSRLDAPSGGSPDSPPDVALRWFGGAKLETHVANLDVHVGVIMRTADADANGGDAMLPVQCEVLFRENSPMSLRAMQFVETRLQAVNEATLRTRLAQLRVPVQLPAEVSLRSISTGSGAPFSLATLVPLVLILMTITGSVYPAIDLTAGERERRTMETLIAAPISRMALLVAKYAAVLIVAVLTAMVNLLAMTVTLLTSSLGVQLFPEGLSPLLFIEIFGLMILFAAFFSAIVLTLTSFARSFKEAQAYLIPVMLLAISPGLLSLMPGLELSGTLAVAPLVNIVLLSRDILEGTAQPAMAFLAVVSTGVYAIAAIAIASRVFGNDALLYASRGSWSELFQRPDQPIPAATPATTLACLATLFPTYFVMANLTQRLRLDMQSQILANALVTIMVFGLWPLLFALAQHVKIRSGFQVFAPPWLASVCALLLGLTLWPVAYELYLVGERIGLVSLGKSQYSMAQQIVDTFRGLSPFALLGALAVIPAVMEEFFFRGYLFKGLRSRFPGPLIIVVTALIFGLFHVLSPTALMPERFLPSTMLGLVLGWVCYRTGSVVPGMLLHACHNGLLLMMVQQQDWLASRGWNVENSMHVPLSWLAATSGIALAAAAVLFLTTRRSGKLSGKLPETVAGLAAK
jgi:ABC-2 type transport system permease protein/sodium transport system permease protein